MRTFWRVFSSGLSGCYVTVLFMDMCNSNADVDDVSTQLLGSIFITFINNFYFLGHESATKTICINKSGAIDDLLAVSGRKIHMYCADCLFIKYCTVFIHNV